MSAADLPDDMRDWPADPFELLGVRPGASETDIKRAYTRLIRRFKPEHAPDQFRRIREAYEECLQRFRWHFPFPAPTDDAPEPVIVRPTPEDLSPAPEPPVADDAPAPRPRPVRGEADRLWDTAAGGDEAAAYAGLKELAAARPDDPDPPLRLYWLLGLNPALDADRTRLDWLADALRRSRLAGPAAELYRRELDARPAAALSGRFADLLAAPADPDHLLTVARWRLAAAGRHELWAEVDTDLRTLAGRLPHADEVGWLGLVVSALDWTAWAGPPAYHRGRDELAKLRHLELSHSYLFDRVDETEHLAAAWRAAEYIVPAAVARLVPAAWAGHGEATAAEVWAAAEAIADQPGVSLGWFDRLAREAGPGPLLILAGAFDRFRHSRGAGPDFPPDLVRGLGRKLAAGGDRRHPSYNRAVRLDFLLDEALDPLEFAEACAGDPDHRVREAAGQLGSDLSLRLVWLACRVRRG
jgi:hypothetical protein